MRSVTEIDSEIRDVEQQLERVTGTETEIYTRIVGYYRSLRNWNRGKKEEYRHRVTFDDQNRTDLERTEAERGGSEETSVALHQTHTTALDGSYARPELLFFRRDHCPHCPPMKQRLNELGTVWTEIDVDDGNGFEQAKEWAVLATPTVIVLDESGAEIRRLTAADAVTAEALVAKGLEPLT